jgi:hypothetical protein
MARDTVTPAVGSAESLEELVATHSGTLRGVEGSVIGGW